MTNFVESVSAGLFAEAGGGVFAVLDGASIPGLRHKLAELQPESKCLFPGGLGPERARVAPYLVRLEPQAEFTAWLIEQGWGKHWGIWAVSHFGMSELYRHFSRLLTVRDSRGRQLHFRYYDPRVLRVFLPTCTARELKTIFGPVVWYAMEAEQPGALVQFRFSKGALMRSEEPTASGRNHAGHTG